MAYTTEDIILWGKISQPLSALDESKKRATVGSTVDTDLHIKLYVERKSVEWYNSQATQDADILYQISNWLFALEGIHGLKAQYISNSGGGIISTITRVSGVEPLDFIVSGASIIATGESTVSLVAYGFLGYNIELTRGGITQFTTDPGDGTTYYSWNRTSGTLILINGAAQLGEQIRIFPSL